MPYKHAYTILLLLSSTLFTVSSVHAQWMLDNEESLLRFVTIKADNIGEVHSFDNLSGSISNTGRMELVGVERLREVAGLTRISNAVQQALL